MQTLTIMRLPLYTHAKPELCDSRESPERAEEDRANKNLPRVQTGFGIEARPNWILVYVVCGVPAIISFGSAGVFEVGLQGLEQVLL